jgi:N-acylglucosamine 2-epimerase
MLSLPADIPAFYEKELRESILPFWLKHAPDYECGGYFTCLDRDGSVYDPGKLCMFGQGRISWSFSWLYNELEAVPEWLTFARRGVDFLIKHGFDSSGRAYYATKQNGAPTVAGSDYYIELSTILAYNELARATKDESLRRRARDLFDCVWAKLQDPHGGWQSPLAGNEPIRIHGQSMITLNVLQQLRTAGEEPTDRERIDTCIDAIARYHTKRDLRLLLEVVGWDGTPLKESRGRWVNPGHMIEGGLFIIHEGQHRNDPALKQQGLELIRWGFECGWDREFGGIFNDIDSEGKPIPGQRALLADGKLWWQHAEALYGLLLAYVESGDKWFLESFKKVHDYSFRHFADPEYGEWYALLDRTGRPVNRAKGMDRKSCYHIVRNFFWISQLKKPATKG